MNKCIYCSGISKLKVSFILTKTFQLVVRHCLYTESFEELLVAHVAEVVQRYQPRLRFLPGLAETLRLLARLDDRLDAELLGDGSSCLVLLVLQQRVATCRTPSTHVCKDRS